MLRGSLGNISSPHPPADGEHRQDVVARAAVRPPVVEERGAGMPRHRRGVRGMEQRHAHRDDSEQGKAHANRTD